MAIRIIHLGALICVVFLTACATVKPAALNSYNGQERPDSEVALVRKVSSGLSAIDGEAIPSHPDAQHFYYRDIRLLPGRHTLELHNTWSASVLVSPSGYVEGSQSLTLDVQAGHLYELHSDRTHGDVRLFFWVEDATAKKVVAGAKFGGPDNRELIKLKWSWDEKRIVLLNPRFDLIEHVVGGQNSRGDWNETGKALALKHIAGEFSTRGIVTMMDEQTGSGSACSPDTETGVTPACGENLRNRFQADYGLFLDVHDLYSSRGLVAGRAVAAVLLFPVAASLLVGAIVGEEGAAPPACLSLIDTHSGEVVWRRCMNSSPNWLEDGSVKREIQTLLKSFPAA